RGGRAKVRLARRHGADASGRESRQRAHALLCTGSIRSRRRSGRDSCGTHHPLAARTTQRGTARGMSSGAVANKPGLLERLKSGLSRTASGLSETLTALFTKRRLDAQAVQQLEDALIRAD